MYCPFVSVVHVGYGTQQRHTPGGLPIDRGKCYYGVKLSDKAGWNEMNWNKLEQLEKCTISKVGEGMAQVFNDLSNPLLSAWEARTLPLSYARSLNRILRWLKSQVNRQRSLGTYGNHHVRFHAHISPLTNTYSP